MRETSVIASRLTMQMGVRAQGLEPWTYGLKVRCSTN